MSAEELYNALKEIERTTEAANRERLVQVLVKRVVEYNTE